MTQLTPGTFVVLGEESPTITTEEAESGRIVFSEESNPDGWIGTDLVVDVER